MLNRHIHAFKRQTSVCAFQYKNEQWAMSQVMIPAGKQCNARAHFRLVPWAVPGGPRSQVVPPCPGLASVSNPQSGFCGSEREALVWAPGFQCHLPRRRVKQGPGRPLCGPLSLVCDAGGGQDLCGPPDILGPPGPLALSARRREDISQDSHGSCPGPAAHAEQEEGSGLRTRPNLRVGSARASLNGGRQASSL